MTSLYPNPSYYEVCYKGTAFSLLLSSEFSAYQM